ncbi:hypothetical protein KC887_04895 [Candidatus Kaiserbacteria bacterium]|nr:hypothetical protein [Candidatus Kaiserbacteria bacterium]
MSSTMVTIIFVSAAIVIGGLLAYTVGLQAALAFSGGMIFGTAQSISISSAVRREMRQ